LRDKKPALKDCSVVCWSIVCWVGC